MQSIVRAKKEGILTPDCCGHLLENARKSPNALEVELTCLKEAWEEGMQPDKFYYALWLTRLLLNRLPTDAELLEEGCVVFSQPQFYRLSTDMGFAQQSCEYLRVSGCMAGMVPLLQTCDPNSALVTVVSVSSVWSLLFHSCICWRIADISFVRRLVDRSHCPRFELPYPFADPSLRRLSIATSCLAVTR